MTTNIIDNSNSLVVNETTGKLAAKTLIETGSYLIDFSKPYEKWYKWKSGIIAPCYCNCRTLLSFPHERSLISGALCSAARELFSEANMVVGIATAGIPWASFVAHSSNMEMAYVRKLQKEYGTGELIEGTVTENSKVIIVDDLIASGESIKRSIELIESKGAKIVGILSIINWNFTNMRTLLSGYKIACITSYHYILEELYNSNRISDNQKLTMIHFYESPNTYDWNEIND